MYCGTSVEPLSGSGAHGWQFCSREGDRCSGKSLGDSPGPSKSRNARDCEVNNDTNVADPMISGMQVPVSDARLFWEVLRRQGSRWDF